MPSKLRAGGVFPFILIDDRAETTDTQFTLRMLSAQENAELSAVRGEYVNSKSLEERLRFVRSALALTVVDCFLSDSQPIEALLTETECWEVINAATEGATLTADERKKFVSQPSSEMECSAEGVAANA